MVANLRVLVAGTCPAVVFRDRRKAMRSAPERLVEGSREPMSPKRKNMVDMDVAAAEAAGLLKALANQDRLLILCYLADGEKSVGELQELLALRQPTISQQLSRLRFEKLVDCRRDGRTIYYRLSSDEAGAVIELLWRVE